MTAFAFLPLANALLCIALVGRVLTNVILLGRIRRALTAFEQSRARLSAVADELTAKLASTKAEIVHLAGKAGVRPQIGSLR